MAKEEVKRTKQKRGTVVTVEEFLSLERPKGDLIIKSGREQVAVTSLDRIYWPDEKLTKFDLLSYYLKVADYIMPYLQDRPLILKRYPNGITGHSFFQHNIEDFIAGNTFLESFPENFIIISNCNIYLFYFL